MGLPLLVAVLLRRFLRRRATTSGTRLHREPEAPCSVTPGSAFLSALKDRGSALYATLNPWHQITAKRHLAGPAYTRHEITDLPDFPDGLPVILSPAHGEALRALSEVYTLIWATAWVEEANRVISPLLGLPTDIPVIYWPEHVVDKPTREGRNGSWKTKWVTKWLDYFARGLPWVWIDDEVNRFDRKWVRRWYEPGIPPPHLILRVDAYHGLNAKHFAALWDFAATAKRTTRGSSATD